MYLPSHFREDRVPEMHEAIRQARLATLVTFGSEGIEANHVPMLLDPEPAPFGRLWGHLSRANPAWRRARPDAQALAIFLGPEAYISPSWYATKRQTGKVVPTWNYLAVHAYGPVRFIDEPERLLTLVTQLTDRHEAQRPEPWKVSDAPADYIAGMLEGIVGFEIEIARLEGKRKMSQNRPAEDREGAAAGLRREGGPAEAAVAAAMEAAGAKG
jgi:transcriptional regulator